MTRLAPPEPAAMTPEQRRVYDAIASGPRGQVRGPLAVWLHRPSLAGPAQTLGQYCRYGSSLPPRLSELAVLVTAKVWRAEFEWWAHKQHALKAGLASAAIDAIRDGEDPVFESAEESVVYRFSTILNRERAVPDALYREAVDLLGEGGVVDLTGILGYYALISMTLKVFEIEPPAEARRELM
ncbi:MAG: carboxymuconolactone decarboxylase family protein [Kiloniellaceae bacterium]